MRNLMTKGGYAVARTGIKGKSGIQSSTSRRALM
jgi:hypothetical protein